MNKLLLFLLPWLAVVPMAFSMAVALDLDSGDLRFARSTERERFITKKALFTSSPMTTPIFSASIEGRTRPMQSDMFGFLNSLFAPTVEEFNKGVCFRVSGVSYRSLCRWIARLPGATFVLEGHFFWSPMGADREFVFREHTFRVEADPWEGGFWIMPKDGSPHPNEIHDIRQHIEKMHLPRDPRA